LEGLGRLATKYHFSAISGDTHRRSLSVEPVYVFTYSVYTVMLV